MKIVAIIQARMGSSRLPGKTLKLIKERPMLDFTVRRLMKSTKLHQIIVATSTNKLDDQIADFCKTSDITIFRGSENDLLDRYYQCAKLVETDIIVRITGDCPLIDYKIVDQTIDYFLTHDYDQVYNTWFSHSYPSGFDVQVVSFKSMKRYWKTEMDMMIREHSVSGMIKLKSYKIGKFCNLEKSYVSQLQFNYNLLHLSVDTIDDFKLIKKIIENLKEDFLFTDVIDYLNTNPILALSNTDDILKQKILKIKNIN
jgi:spore coat polysaccharide biosynthesis protein SpsF